MSHLSTVISRAEIFPGQGLFTVVHLDQGDASVLAAAVVAWGGEVTAVYERVTLLPLSKWETGLASGDFAPMEAGELAASGETQAALAMLARAGLGEQCAYACGDMEESGVAVIDPARNLWGAATSMTRVNGRRNVAGFME